MRFFKKFILFLCLIISARPAYCLSWDSFISSATACVFRLAKTVYEYKVPVGAIFGIFAMYRYKKYYSSDNKDKEVRQEQKNKISDSNPIQNPSKIIVNPTQNQHFFLDIVGIDEKKFREDYKWQQGKPVDFDEPQKKKWIDEYPRRAAIFYAEPETRTVVELVDLSIVNIGKSIAEYDAQIINESISPLTKKPIFAIQFFDPSKEKKIESDIRWLQAKPQLKGAVFQVASNFNALEGGIGHQGALLGNMLGSPVQGEYAAISAAGGTINRKYFKHPFDLLYRLRGQGIEMDRNNGFETLTSQALKKLKDFKDSDDSTNIIDYKNIAVCLHNTVVTSGAGGPGRWGKFEQRPIVFKNDGKIDPAETQTVKQVFTAVLDTRELGKSNNQILNDATKNLCRLIQKGSYIGTLRAAFCNKEPRVILTLMGGGSFRNDIEWVGEALVESEDFIKEKGMQVVLMYRPDKPRDFAVRTAPGDIEFLKKMVGLASKINNIEYDANINSTIEEYVTKAYNKEPYTKEAQLLQRQFPLDRFYTSETQ